MSLMIILAVIFCVNAQWGSYYGSPYYGGYYGGGGYYPGGGYYGGGGYNYNHLLPALGSAVSNHVVPALSSAWSNNILPTLSSAWSSVQSSGWGTAAKGALAGAVLGGLFG
ncbi:hypothetical protein ANCCEY_03744 [Ancylostoma ceylanicum]|nr:hypothetical protein ANCCEY_03744 [Ancylostoma ceylanicum]